MKCKKCGAEFNEGIFCPECGEKYSDNSEEYKVENSSNVETYHMKEKKPKSKFVIYGIAGCSIVVLAISVLAFIGGSTDGTRIESNNESQDNLTETDVSEQELETAMLMSPAEVVSNHIKAELACDEEAAVSLCTDDYKPEIRDAIKGIEQIKAEAYQMYMDIVVEEAQTMFYRTAIDEVIDAEYLRDDKEIKKAINDFSQFLVDELYICSIDENVDMKDDGTAVVSVEMSAKKGISDGLEANYFDSYLQTIALSKLSENSNILKEQAAKKIVKETMLATIKDIKEAYEKTDDAEVLGKRYYFLNQDSGKWLIYKKEGADTLGEEPEEEFTYEVSFVDGLTYEVISEQTVKKGDDAVVPDAPLHEGYTFKQWEGVYEDVNQYETVYAVYDKDKIMGIIEGYYSCEKQIGDYTYIYTISIQKDNSQDNQWVIKVNYGDGSGYSGGRIFEGYTEINADYVNVHSIYIGYEEYCLDIYKSNEGGIDVTCNNIPSNGSFNGFYDCSGHYNNAD